MLTIFGAWGSSGWAGVRGGLSLATRRVNKSVWVKRQNSEIESNQRTFVLKGYEVRCESSNKARLVQDNLPSFSHVCVGIAQGA